MPWPSIICRKQGIKHLLTGYSKHLKLILRLPRVIRIFEPVKKAIFLLIAAGIMFSQFSIPTVNTLEDDQIVLLPTDESDDQAPLDPMEEYPEEGETEDSSENKDDDSKKWQQHRLFAKVIFVVSETSWNIHEAEQAIKPHISKIQQPPEGSFSA